MLLLIDNYDSFTFNLVQAIGSLDPGNELRVVRNDDITVDQIDEETVSALIISPGPCSPAEAGISNEAITRFHGRIPILGVCLGHQCIAHVFGAPVGRAPEVMHGKTSLVHHNGTDIFRGIESPLEVMRYHSLIATDVMPLTEFTMTAWTDNGICMGLAHQTHPTYGVQFHPESFLTTDGPRLMQNFLDIAQQWNQSRGKRVREPGTTTP